LILDFLFGLGYRLYTRHLMFLLCANLTFPWPVTAEGADRPNLPGLPLSKTCWNTLNGTLNKSDVNLHANIGKTFELAWSTRFWNSVRNSETVWHSRLTFVMS